MIRINVADDEYARITLGINGSDEITILILSHGTEQSEVPVSLVNDTYGFISLTLLPIVSNPIKDPR